MLSLVLLLAVVLWTTAGGGCLTLNVSSDHDLITAVTRGLAQANGSLHINLLTDVVLDSPIMFVGLQSCWVEGVGGVRLLTCPRGHNAGLLFQGTAAVSLTDLTLSGCAAVQQYPFSGGSVMFSSALHIVTTQHVYLSRVTIEASPGAGLLMAQNSGVTNVSNCHFLSNRMQHSAGQATSVFGGGGVYLQISHIALNSRVVFSDCVFRDNVAGNTRDQSYVFADGSDSPVGGRGRGGGMFVNQQESVKNSTTTLERCHFINNLAFLGSGLSLEVEHSNSLHNSILIKNCWFTANGCQGNSTGGVGSGGGVQVSFRTVNTILHHSNRIKFQSTEFTSNCALLGGGTYFYSNTDTNPNVSNQLVFDNCTWSRNHAHTGSAVDITSDIFERTSSGFRLVPIFKDCVFTRNSIAADGKGQQHNFGSSTLYSSLYDITFLSSAVFSQNTGTAVHVVNAIANFTGSSGVFEGNSGIQGGGVALIGTSSMLIGPHNYRFVNNSATDKGGAIYSQLVDTHDFTVSRSCFLRYSDSRRLFSLPSTEWRARVYFEGNTAHSHHGNDIFVTSLLPCQVVNMGGSSSNFEVVDSASIFLPPGMVFAGGVSGLSISTDGARFSESSEKLRIVPGEQFQHGVYIIDDLDHQIDTMLIASFPTRSSTITLDDSSYCLTNQIIQLSGRPHETDTLLLQAINSRRISLTLEVTLVDCPPGFALIDGHCNCDAFSHQSLVRCDSHQLHSYIRPGFWTGYINTTDGERLASGACPLGFCNYYSNFSSVFEVALPRSRDGLELAVCGMERGGVLCGRCNPGYMVHFHSPHFECEEEPTNTCSLGWLFYLLSEIFPATILFVVILVFNVSFTSGALNGFLLFSQLFDTLLIDAVGVIAFPTGVQYAIQAIRLVYGFFNLDFFYAKSLSFCLWREASVLDIIAFKYVTIGYSVLLIAAVILLLKHCGARCLGRYYRVSIVRNSVIQGLSAFLVICYTQCIKVSFSLLYFGRIHLSSTETNVSVPKRVWYNGELEFFAPQHLPYALPALAVLLTVGVVPPAILLTYPAVLRIMACLGVRDSIIGKCLVPYSTLKPFLDAFQGSFKDNFRFFAGLYFIYRWTGIFLYAVISSYSTFYTFLEIALIVILVLHSVCRPYRKTWHNILDTLLIADVAIINRLTAVHYYGSRVDTGMYRQVYISKSSVVQLILILLPAAYLACYVLVQVVRKTCCKDPLQRQRAMLKMRELFSHSKKQTEDHTSQMLELDEYSCRLSEYVSTSSVSIQ